MATLGDLIAEVEDFLTSHGADRDIVTTLTTVGGITAAATTLDVSDGGKVSAGLIEIDYELIQVESKSGNAVTVPAWGRGQRGTVAATHAQNARVAVNPRFPRSRIKSEINQAIVNLFPSLFAVAVDTTNVMSAAKTTYPLPALTESVLKVAVDSRGPSKMWQPLRRYRFDRTADTTEFPTGRTLDVLDGSWPGQKLQVVYTKRFTELALDGDTLASVGLEDQWRDLITMQVCAKLVMALDSVRLQTGSVEQQNRAGLVQVGGATSVARRLMETYRERLDAERTELLRRHPMTPVYNA